jgi:hypothetical protein
MAIGNVFDYLSSVSKAAEVLSTSHQNVKQIALNLKKGALLKLSKMNAIEEEDC